MCKLFLYFLKKLSGKTKVNANKGNAADYYIDFKFSKESSARFTHKQNQFEIDGNAGLWTRNDIHLSLYHYHKLVQDAKTRAEDGKVHLRIHHPNVIASFGIQNHDYFKHGNIPQLLSAWVLGGVKKDNFSVFGGVQTGYNTASKLVPFADLLVGLKHKKITGYLNWATQRTEEKKDNVSTIKTSHEVKAFFDSRPNSDLLVFGEATTNLEKLTSVIVGGEYNLDKSTRLKIKASDKKDVSISVIHNFNNMVNFSFVSKVNKFS